VRTGAPVSSSPQGPPSIERAPRLNKPKESIMSKDLPDIGEIKTTVVDGLKIRFARTGANAGIPVLLTSPWPESIYAFRGVTSELGKHFPLLLLDLPGFGRSEGRADVFSPEGMGDFIIKAAEHFAIERMHAIGPDVGTTALLFAAVRRPTLFESLVVGSGATSPDLAASHLRDLINSPIGAFTETEGGDLGAGFVSQSAMRGTPAAVLEDYRLSSAGRRFEDAANFVRAYPRDLPRLRLLLPTIETPVLIIAGKHDPIVPPPNGQLLADRLPRNRYTLLEGGHLVWEDAPEEYAGQIEAWLNAGYQSA
jgi:pimeloyl-ACP methyl ester carboxylesterase